MLATAIDTELDWDETLEKTGPLVKETDSAVKAMEKAEKKLSGDEAKTGKKLTDAAASIAKDMSAVQSGLEEFIASEDIDYDLDPIEQQTTKLSESSEKYNGLVKEWNGLDATKGSDDLQLEELDDSWADILGFAEKTLEERGKAFLADFVAAFDSAADAFITSAASFLDTMNGLVNTNPAGIPAATQPMIAGMAEAVKTMQELTSGLDETLTVVQVTATAAILLDLANQMVASVGDVAAFNQLVEKFNTTLEQFRTAYAGYEADAAEVREDSGDA